jgi:hypothetical protein
VRLYRDAYQRRPHKNSFHSIIQLTRNAERGIRSLLIILTLLSRKGCARPNKTYFNSFIPPLRALFLYTLKYVKKYLIND